MSSIGRAIAFLIVRGAPIFFVFMVYEWLGYEVHLPTFFMAVVMFIICDICHNIEKSMK